MTVAARLETHSAWLNCHHGTCRNMKYKVAVMMKICRKSRVVSQRAPCSLVLADRNKIAKRGVNEKK